jgi:hypothetical protein
VLAAGYGLMALSTHAIIDATPGALGEVAATP